MEAGPTYRYVLVPTECSRTFFAVNIAHSLQVVASISESDINVITETWLCGLQGFTAASFSVSDNFHFFGKPSFDDSLETILQYSSTRNTKEVVVILRWCDLNVQPIYALDRLMKLHGMLKQKVPLRLILMPDGWRNIIPLEITRAVCHWISEHSAPILFGLSWGKPSHQTTIGSDIIDSFSLSPWALEKSLDLYQTISQPSPLPPLLDRIDFRDTHPPSPDKPVIFVISMRAWFSDTHLDGMYNFNYDGLSSEESHLLYLAKVTKYISALYGDKLCIVAIASDSRIEQYCQPGLIDKLKLLLAACLDYRVGVHEIGDLVATSIPATLDSRLIYLARCSRLVLYSYDSSTALPIIAAGKRIDSFHGLYEDSTHNLNVVPKSIEYINTSVANVVDFASASRFNVQRCNGLTRVWNAEQETE